VDTPGINCTDMFVDMLDALEEGRQPMETFYDGCVVKTVMDVSYRSIETKSANAEKE